MKDSRLLLAIVTTIAFVTMILHLLNLYYYPAWFFDEGAYLTFSFQWLRTGQLTYYGHPFAFLAFLAIIFVTANPVSYFLPRLLMVVFSAVDTVMVYFVASIFYRKGRLFPTTAALIYAATPLSIRYLRLVVVDNFMTFFLIGSILLLLVMPKKYWYSGLCFGIALISKQTAIFFLPAMVILLWEKIRLRQVTTYVVWLALAACPVIIWVAYGTIEVGLSNVISQQFALTNLGGERAVNALSLIIQRITSRDPFIFIGIVGIVWAIYRRYLLVLFPIFYLVSFVILFLKISTVYLIPVLPFFSILAAYLIFDFMKYFPSLFGRRDFRILSVSCLILLLAIVSAGIASSENPATAQEKALHYVGSLGSVNVVASYTYLWLLEQNYPRVHAYDRYNVAAWTSLPPGTRLYLIVDYPGDLLTIRSIPQMNATYVRSPKINFTDPGNSYLVQIVNSTLGT